MNDHDEIEHAVAAYVLGAGEPHEADYVRAHLDACAGCRELATRLGRAVAVLPLATVEVEPPARLKERILIAAAAMPRSVERATQRRGSLIRLRPPRPRMRFGLNLPGYAAAAVVAALIVGAGLGAGVSRYGPLAPTAPAPATERFSLSGSGSMVGSRAQVIELRQEGITLVDFKGLPQLEQKQVYQLWLVPARGLPVSAGVFSPERDGGKVVLLSRDLKGYKVLAVTVEPGPDGSPQPTRQPDLAGQVA